MTKQYGSTLHLESDSSLMGRLTFIHVSFCKANIGYEFAERFLKCKHAFMDCTHVDKNHIHNHIVWNATALDGIRKFRNSFYSAYAGRKFSDPICMEYGLSIVENPQRFQSKDRQHFEPTHRDDIRTTINSVLKNQFPDS